jgi:hypothetical protein
MVRAQHHEGGQGGGRQRRGQRQHVRHGRSGGGQDQQQLRGSGDRGQRRIHLEGRAQVAGVEIQVLCRWHRRNHVCDYCKNFISLKIYLKRILKTSSYLMFFRPLY